MLTMWPFRPRLCLPTLFADHGWTASDWARSVALRGIGKISLMPWKHVPIKMLEIFSVRLDGIALSLPVTPKTGDRSPQRKSMNTIQQSPTRGTAITSVAAPIERILVSVTGGAEDITDFVLDLLCSPVGHEVGMDENLIFEVPFSSSHYDPANQGTHGVLLRVPSSTGLDAPEFGQSASEQNPNITIVIITSVEAVYWRAGAVSRRHQRHRHAQGQIKPQ